MSRIDDGHPTLMTFAEDASISLWEKSVTPPGVEGGGENDTTTMHNSIWRTKSPKQLKTLTPASATAAYDPAVYDEIIAMLNVNQAITITFADASTLVFWGWIDVFAPGEAVEGAQPTADLTIIPSNQDADGDEIAPDYSA